MTDSPTATAGAGHSETREWIEGEARRREQQALPGEQREPEPEELPALERGPESGHDDAPQG